MVCGFIAKRSQIMRTIIAAFGLVVCLSVQAGAETNITSDVIYGHKDGMALTYDVFQPQGANGAAVIYMVSGGWFSMWQPAEQRLGSFKGLLDEGFTVMAVHHGSAPKFKVPDAVSDVRAAVRHIKANADAYDVDPDRLGVWGGSAGGHLSLMLGLNSEGPEAAKASADPRARFMGPRYKTGADSDASLAAVVAYYPPVDIRPITGPNERFPALDFSADQAAAISPILFVDKNDPPIKLIHGDADGLVPLTTSTTIKAALDKEGVANDLLVIEGGDHGFRNPEHRAAAGVAMVAWFKQHLTP
jgi:acetyl esterase/lipase